MKQNWEYKKLGDVCDSLNGLWTGKKEPFVNVAVIRNTNFSKDCKLKLDDVAYLDVEQKQYSTRKLIPGDIIVEKSGGSDKQPVGRVVLFDIPDGEYSFSNFTGTLRIKNPKELNSRYLYRCLVAHYLRGETRKLQSKTTGLHNLDMKGYLKLPIPIPPLAEQQRIVAELDLLTGIIDKQNAQLKELDALAQSIFYDMFGDPIENPKGWDVKKLGDVCSVVNGLVDPNEEPYCNYPHIGGANIQSNTGVFVDVKLAKDEGLISGKYLFDESMILYSKIRPNLNKVALPSFKGICSADMYPLITNTDIANKYYIKFSITHKKFIEYAVSHSGRANIPKINREALLAYDLPLPPLSLQQSFAEKIQSIEKQKETIRASIADTQKLLDYTMDKYFG